MCELMSISCGIMIHLRTKHIGTILFGSNKTPFFALSLSFRSTTVDLHPTQIHPYRYRKPIDIQ